MPNHTSEAKQLEWKNLIEQQVQSGLSVEKWCLQHQVRHHTFRYWKDKLFYRPLQKANFTELNIKRSDAISLQVHGVSVRIGSDCDPHLRKQLFALFAELP